jgi:ParB/RepB/Spo0J family partition protein
MEIPISNIETNANQPRQYFDEQADVELRESIRNHGLLQPVAVRRKEERFVLVAGERRFRAFKALSKETIPAVVVDGDPTVLAIIENLCRQDLGPIDEAETLDALMQEKGWSQKILSATIGKAESTLSETLALMNLPVDVREKARNHPGLSRAKLLKIAKTPRNSKKTTADEMRAAFEKLLNGEGQTLNPTSSTDKLLAAVDKLRKLVDKYPHDPLDSKATEEIKSSFSTLVTACKEKFSLAA